MKSTKIEAVRTDSCNYLMGGEVFPRKFIISFQNFPRQTCTVLYMDIFQKVDDRIEIAAAIISKISILILGKHLNI